MSDEYGSQGGGFKGSLVDDSLDQRDTNSGQSNYPQPDSQDTTSSGGYGTNASGNSFSRANQMGLSDQPRDQGVFSSSSEQNPIKPSDGYQVADPTQTAASDQETSGNADRRAEIHESGGAAAASGTLNDVGA